MRVFRFLSTQWTVGFGGPTGLRYEVLPLALRINDVPRADWPDVIDGVRVLESEALRLWNEKRS